MQRKQFTWSILLMLLFSIHTLSAQDIVQTSVDFLTNLKNNQPTDEQEAILKNISIEEAEKQLDTNTKRLVFWVNVYNSYIQKILKDKPEWYETRGKFFKEKMLPIMGMNLSFADIEHGMIRRSQYEYFLGYVTNPFAPKYEKRLRVFERDMRIHFALNCGAKDCPPVAIYTVDRYDEQMEKGTKQYLEFISTLEPQWSKVKTTPLMSWFRGDFGGKKGAKKLLAKHGIIPTHKGWEIAFKGYDWTLYLDNYIEL